MGGSRTVAVLMLGALALVGGAAGADRGVPVALRVVGPADLSVGQAAHLSAAARLPAGARLVIRAIVTGRGPETVAQCLRSPCRGSFRRRTQERVFFQAVVIGRAGSRMTMLGRSALAVVVWNAAPAPVPELPAPAAPPAAARGHFAGTIGNAQTSLAFDIGADGISMLNLATGEIDESCDSDRYTYHFDGFNGSGPYPVATDGSFLIGGSNTSDPTLSYSIKFTGKVTGTTASGILHVESSYLLSDGNRLNCTSGDQPWTAAKTG